MAVSYTHLDVYKRQSMSSCHGINTPVKRVINNSLVLSCERVIYHRIRDTRHVITLRDLAAFVSVRQSERVRQIKNRNKVKIIIVDLMLTVYN